MIRMSLDLEMNDNPERDIIQIGACSFEVETGTILNTFSRIIKRDTPVSEYITKLTGINQTMIDNGIDLNLAYYNLVEFVSSEKVQKYPIIVWGSGDLPLLKSQLPDGIEWVFGRTEMNVKNLYQAYRESKGLNIQGGLASALRKFDLNFIGRKHDAKDDAVNTARIYHAILTKLKTC